MLYSNSIEASAFGTYGAQGYGYSIKRLISEIEKIIGIDHCHHVVIIGVGGLGGALLEHLEFKKYGYHVIAGFDIAPELIGTKVNDVLICSMDDLGRVVKNHQVEICVLTVPKSAVKQVSLRMKEVGIPAVWNFTNVNLELGESIAVENIDFIDSLFVLTYYMKKKMNENKKRYMMD